MPTDIPTAISPRGSSASRRSSTASATPRPVGRPRPEASTSGPSAIGRAFRMSSEFVAGVIAGGGLGWLLDRLLGTSPWGLIVFLLLGFAAGTFNVVRAAGATTTSGGTGSKPPNS